MKRLICFAAIVVSQAALAQMPDLSNMPKSIPQGALPTTATGASASASAGSMDAKSLMKKASEQAVVHLNSATPAQLGKVPGLSPENATAIIAARPFKSVTELAKVKGIGPALYAKIKPYVKL